MQIMHTSQKAVKSSWQLFGMAESSEKFLNTAKSRLMSLELSDKVSWYEYEILIIFVRSLSVSLFIEKEPRKQLRM